MSAARDVVDGRNDVDPGFSCFGIFVPTAWKPLPTRDRLEQVLRTLGVLMYASRVVFRKAKQQYSQNRIAQFLEFKVHYYYFCQQPQKIILASTAGSCRKVLTCFREHCEL